MKFSFKVFLILFITFPSLNAKELTGIFLRFDKSRLMVTVLTNQGKISLKINPLNENIVKILENLRQGYVVKVNYKGKILKEIKLEEKPQ